MNLPIYLSRSLSGGNESSSTSNPVLDDSQVSTTECFKRDDIWFWFNKFIDYLTHERRASEYTVRNYSQAIRRFFNWLEDTGDWNGHIDAIPMQSIRSYIVGQQRKISRRTLHNHMSALKAFYLFLRRRKIAFHNPFQTVTLPKLVLPIPIYMSEQQMIQFLDVPMSLCKTGKLTPFRAWRDTLIFELLYGGGMRVSELIGLNYGHIDEAQGVATVMGKGNKERLCPLGEVAMKCLKTFKSQFAKNTGFDNPVIIKTTHKRMAVRTVQFLMKKYLRIANLPVDMTPHKIRHSYATHLYNNGANLRLLQELLGHASLSTTQIYTHVGIARLQKVHAEAHPRA